MVVAEALRMSLERSWSSTLQWIRVGTAWEPRPPVDKSMETTGPPPSGTGAPGSQTPPAGQGSARPAQHERSVSQPAANREARTPPARPAEYTELAGAFERRPRPQTPIQPIRGLNVTSPERRRSGGSSMPPPPPPQKEGGTAKSAPPADPDAWALRIYTIVRQWHDLNGVTGVVTDPRSLFPGDWTLGRTRLVYDPGVAGRYLRRMLPDLKCYTAKGLETAGVVQGSDDVKTARITAEWRPPVHLVAEILSYKSERTVSADEVVALAQSAPDALEKLKEAGKSLKAHFTRLLDMVALRRSPAYNETAARYKAQLKVLIQEQYNHVLALKQATKRVNDLLAERDAELARLDPGYTPKKQSAQDALARYGIDLGSEGGEESWEEANPDNPLPNLDF
nr:coat protein [Alternaria longipes dsRNA virus 1]